MPYQQEHGLVSRTELTADERARIARLADDCARHDGADLGAFASMALAFQGTPPQPLVYRYGQLIGFVAFQGTLEELEASLMVDPNHRRQGVGRELLQTAVLLSRQRGVTNLRLIAEEAVPAGGAFLAAMGARYSASEYRMLLSDGGPARLPAPGLLQIERIGPRALPAFVAVSAAAFGEDAARVERRFASLIVRPDNTFYLARLAGAPVGTARAVVDTGNVYITTLGVLPAYQGQGFGRQILRHVVAALRAEGWSQIYLEVATANRRALSLYHSCGFRVVNAYAYHDLAL